MEKKTTKNIITIIMCFLVLGMSVWFLIQKKELFSAQENRYYETFPKFTLKNLESGKYTKGLENYFSDHFPLRDNFMSLKTKVDKTLGKKDINDVYLGKDDYLLQKFHKMENQDKIVERLNSLFDKISYVNMELMLVPTSITINKDKLPTFAPTISQTEAIKQIYSKVYFNKIDVTDALIKGNEEYPMFYRLDHHWTSYGAYYAYLEYCKSNNITPLSINDFKIEKVSDDFNGTLYSKTNDYTRKSDSIVSFIPKNHNYTVNYVNSNRTTSTLYEEKYLKEKDKYAYFLDSNHPLVEITNHDIKNGKELLIIKDSYANSMIPFLINHFEKIHVIDPRFYLLDISTYVKEHPSIKDVLVLYNMNTIDADTGITTIS